MRAFSALRTRGQQVGLGLAQPRLEERRVEPGDHPVLVTFELKSAPELLDGARDLRAHLHGLHGLQGARGSDHLGHRPPVHGGRSRNGKGSGGPEDQVAATATSSTGGPDDDPRLRELILQFIPQVLAQV